MPRVTAPKGSQAEKVIQLARVELGYHEGRSGGHWNNDNKFAGQMGWANHQAWCATFVCSRFKAAGLLSLITTPSPGCDPLSVGFKRARRWSEYPAIGAVVFFGIPSDLSHVGIVEAYDDDFIWTIEGNTNESGAREGDGVYAKRHLRRDARVVGYGYLAYSEGTISADPAWQKTPEPPVGGGPARRDGVDVSHHQLNKFDLAAAAKGGVRFVIHKATEALDFVDQMYTVRRDQVENAELIWGAYHFARPGRSSGTAQARKFLGIARLVPGDLLPVLDLEDTGGLSRRQLTRWVGEFVAVCKDAHGGAIIYTSDRFPLDDDFDCPLWVPRYNDAMEPPRVPAPWREWAMWQFTNGQDGKPDVTPGLGRVDANTLNRGVKLADLRIKTPRTGPPNTELQVVGQVTTGHTSLKWDAPDEAFVAAIRQQRNAAPAERPLGVFSVTEATVDGKLEKAVKKVGGLELIRLDDKPGQSNSALIYDPQVEQLLGDPWVTQMSTTQWRTSKGFLQPPIFAVAAVFLNLETRRKRIRAALHGPVGGFSVDGEPGGPLRHAATLETLDTIPEIWKPGRKAFPDAARELQGDLNLPSRREWARQLWEGEYPRLAVPWDGIAGVTWMAAGAGRLRLERVRRLPLLPGLDHRGIQGTGSFLARVKA